MKKVIVITFNIFKDWIDNQKPYCTLYGESVPDNPNEFSKDELMKSGFKKQMNQALTVKKINGINKNYSCKITEEQLKELLDF